MGRELGRISGPLLADNLLRNGNNLAFETQLLYFDVTNKRIGINNNAPATVDLYVTTTIRTNILNVPTLSNLANFTVSTNQIQNTASSITISPNQSGTPVIVAPQLKTDNLLFNTNTITNYVSNSDINIGLTSSTTSQIKLNNEVLVDGNLHATGNITWDGNVTFGNAPTDTVTFDAEVNSDILPSATLTDNLGSPIGPLYWKNIYVNNALGNIVTPYFTISGNTIAGNVADGTVNYTANGTGSVNTEYLSWSDNNITNQWPTATTNTQKSILFSPNGTGNVLVNSTKSVILPIGDDYTRVLLSNGEVRFNDLNLNIEGYSDTGYVNFINLFSQDHKTYITGELTTNSSDNTLRFAVNNVVTTTVTPTELKTVNLVSGNLALTTNTIKSTVTDGNTLIAPNGLGVTNFDNFVSIGPNIITNKLNSSLTFNSTAYGHWHFTGLNGIVIPIGTGTNYVPPQGTVRYNNVIAQGEVYSSIYGWMPWVGATNTTISQQDGEDLSVIYTLMLGL